jgi:hypothetical protein
VFLLCARRLCQNGSSILLRCGLNLKLFIYLTFPGNSSKYWRMFRLL